MVSKITSSSIACQELHTRLTLSWSGLQHTPFVSFVLHFRRCLRPLILLLDTTPCPALPGLVDASNGAELIAGGAELAKADGRTEQRQSMVAQLLVGELVLATKEVGSGA